jgi:hypothetical protein
MFRMRYQPSRERRVKGLFFSYTFIMIIIKTQKLRRHAQLDLASHSNKNNIYLQLILFYSDGISIGTPSFTGSPKLGVPSLFHENFCALGERCQPQPSFASLFA